MIKKEIIDINELSQDWSKLCNKLYFLTEKIEGNSFYFGLDNFISTSLLPNNIEEALSKMNLENHIFQGVEIGPVIKDNYYELETSKVLICNIFNKDRLVNPRDQKKIVKQLGLEYVPVANVFFTPYGMTIKEVELLADGVSDLNPNKLRKGLVFTSHDGKVQWKI